MTWGPEYFDDSEPIEVSFGVWADNEEESVILDFPTQEGKVIALPPQQAIAVATDIISAAYSLLQPASSAEVQTADEEDVGKLIPKGATSLQILVGVKEGNVLLSYDGSKTWFSMSPANARTLSAIIATRADAAERGDTPKEGLH